MNYIKRENKGVIVDDIYYDIPIGKYIESIALNNFKSIKSIKKTVEVKINIKKYKPLYISDSILLIPSTDIRSYDSFIFNYFEIDFIKVEKDYTIFIFKDKTHYKLNISRYRMNNILKNAKKVYEYITMFDYKK